MYHGDSDFDWSKDCNVKKNFIFDASFNKEQVMDMLVSLYNDDRVVEIEECECVKSDRLYLEDL
jgi:hypothetical protein